MIYLDNAAGSHPKPPAVAEAMSRALLELGNPGRGSYRLARDTDALVDEARAALAQLIHAADKRRIVFTSGATESANMAIKGLLKAGDHVVVSGLEHNAVWRPLKQLEAERGIKLTVIPTDRWGYVKADAFAAAITDATRLICCSMAGNVSGAVQPIAELGAIARARRIPLLVDAAQGAGWLPIDVQAQGIDLLVLAGHKALLGPPGIGALYVAEGLQLSPLLSGGSGSNSREPFQPREYPAHLEAGSANVPGIAGWLAALQREGDRAAEYAQAMALADAFAAGVRKIEGARLYLPPDAEARPRVPLVALNLTGVSSAEAAALLDSGYGIAVRGGYHCAPQAHSGLGTLKQGSLRFSFGIYNTESDVQAALLALKRIAQNHPQRPPKSNAVVVQRSLKRRY